MGTNNEQTCFRKPSSSVPSLWPTWLLIHSFLLTIQSSTSQSPNQTSPPSSLPSRLADSSIPSPVLARSQSSPLLTKPSQSSLQSSSKCCSNQRIKRRWQRC